MTRHPHRLLPLLFIALAACSTSQGFDRAEIQEALRQQMPLGGARASEPPEAKNAAEHYPSLAGPFRLGIYFVRSEFPARQSVQSGEWLSAEKDRLAHRLDPLRTEQILRDVVVLAELAVQPLTSQELRRASTRHGIDLLLLVDGIGAVDRYNNAYSFFYPTILGAWLAPGTVVDALFTIDGLLWDPQTGMAPDWHTAEGQAQRIGAAVLVENAEALKEAKGRAIDAFGETLAARLRSLPGKQSGNSPIPR
ncbi:MAG: hypothetical protein IT389_13985 [Nitrospira sp.]|nr:hypothetical protein [Nitrospira sp.]